MAPGVRKYGLYITPIQILQFILCLLSLIPDAIDILLYGGARCGATKRGVAWIVFAYGFYLVLFTKMFNAKKKAASNSDTEASQKVKQG